MAHTLMVQGCTSDAGKSTLVTALARVLHRRGVRVVPFKPQNMALNSAVTAEGGEIGRAQAVQAQAAGLAPRIDMNPVLLKPNTDTGAQIIVHGRAIGEMNARTYHDYKPIARNAVLASYGRLVLGVLPYLHGLHLEAEDALPTEAPAAKGGGALRVIVPALPHISNHTDFDPLRLHPQVDFRYVGPGEAPPPADLIILPGSKSVRADLSWLRAQGWEQAVRRHLRYGGKLIGICGGLQMLGRWVRDPLGLEGEAGASVGLALLDLDTVLKPDKQLRNVHGTLLIGDVPVTGYEIHSGATHGPALSRPAVKFDGRDDGAISADGQILVTYLHGVFESSAACAALLAWAGLTKPRAIDYRALREAGIDRLADATEQHLNLARIEALLGRESSSRAPSVARQP